MNTTTLIIVAIVLFIYFLPFLVAIGRQSVNAPLLFFLSLFLNWLILPWFIFLIMATTGDTKKDVEIRNLQLKKLKKDE